MKKPSTTLTLIKSLLGILVILSIFAFIGWSLYQLGHYYYWVNFTEDGRDFRANIDPEWGKVRAQERLSESIRENQNTDH